MTIADLLTNINLFIGDSSTDRLSDADRYSSVTEATAWLLEELGNEHMVDRAEIEYLPSVTWYKMDNLTPYLLTAGQLRFKEEKPYQDDFTRIEARELAIMNPNRNAYAIERFNGDSYVGITIPNLPSTDLIALNKDDGYTYTGVNAVEIVEEVDSIRFDMDQLGETSTGLQTTSDSKSLSVYEGLGFLIFEIEIPDITDVTSVSIKFGTNLTTDYYLGVMTQDINGNALVAGVNTVKIKWSDLTQVGDADLDLITEWEWLVNHETTKPVVGNFKISDLRIAEPVYLNFKYIFYRVGKDTSGTDITEFGATTDVPFFSERYPQYRYAVAHKAAGILFRSLQLIENARSEDSQAIKALERYRKNFSGERDMGSSNFKVAGINLRGRRIVRRR